MSTTKVINNPEVPGLESLLPLPPPPPPPPPSETLASETKPTTVQAQQQAPLQPPVPNVVASGPVPIPFPTVPAAPYFVHPTLPPQSPAPWWVATEADSSDLYDSQYVQWYEATHNAALPANVAGKIKSKFYKRKSETIDPALDAEKVASAQRELTALMKPLKCDLCNAIMNSTLQAKLHYDGKPHQKKVSMFLNQSVKKLKTEDSGQVSSTTEPDWNSYCEICKTWFTSQTDATQHYAGKKHLRAANGGPRVRPSKKYPGQNQYSQVDSTGRFGIGLGFQPDNVAIVPPIVEPTIATLIPAPGPVCPVLPTPANYGAALRCELCGISTNRLDQLETHKRGARHLRMLKLNGLPMPDAAPEIEVTPNVVAAATVTVNPGPIDYSIYRTPSGQYYCAPCNLSLNSETSFAQHVESKKHKNQLNPKQPTPAPNATTPKKAKPKKK